MRLCHGNAQPSHGFRGPSETAPKPSGFASTETIRNHVETGLKPPRNQAETIRLPKTETTETSPYRTGSVSDGPLGEVHHMRHASQKKVLATELDRFSDRSENSYWPRFRAFWTNF